MQYKLIVIGDSGVGKTCILLRYVDAIFKMSHISTIGVDCKEKTIEVDGKLIKLQIWDTAGQERFRTISAQYYRGAKGILLVFDITNQKSFDNVTKWLKSIEQHASSDVERLLVGNKCDLQSKRVIPYNKGQQMAEAQNISYMETSAKTNDNIDKAFEMLARQIIAKTGDKMIVNDHRDGPVLNKYQDSQRKHQGRSSTLEKKSRQDSPIVDLKQKENTNKCSC